MSILGWIVFGFIVTVAIGVVGALVGGFLGRLLGLYHEGDPVGFVMAVIGSIVLLWIYRRTAGAAT